jgi:iron complex outermembrane recepter protein
MNFFKFFLATWALMVVSFTGFAQAPCHIKLSGVVIDRNTGQGLSYASVVHVQTGKPGIADEEGHFGFNGLCNEVVTLNISHVGCASERYELVLERDTNIVIYLSHSEEDLGAVEIVEEQDNATQLTRMEVRSASLMQESGKQLAEMALLLPGMRLLQTGNAIAKPVFRGMHSNRLLLMNNGIRQEGQYWGSEHAPEIDSYVAQSLAVIEGPDALRYASDAIAGILLVEAPDVFAHEKFAGKLQSTLQSNGRGGAAAAELSGSVPRLDGLHYRVQGSLKKLGTMRDSRNFLTNTGVEEWNYSYALGYRYKKWKAEVFYSKFNQRFGLYRYSHLGNLTDLQNVLQGRPQPDTLGFSYDFGRPFQQVSHELFKASLEHRIDERNRIEMVYARQYNRRQEYDVHIGRNPSAEALASPQLDYSLTTHLAEALWHHKPGRVNGVLGVSGMQRRNRYRGREFMPNYENQNLGVFLIERYAFGLWNMTAAVRYDRYSGEVYQPVATVENPVSMYFDGFATSFALRRSITGGDLNFNAGTQWRAPAVNELFSNGLHHGAGGVEVGNPQLDRERSYNAAFTLRKSLPQHKFQAVAYVNYIEDFVFMNPSSVELTIRGAFPRFDFEQTNALFRGIDLNHEAALGEYWSTRSTASLVWADNLQNSTFFIGIPAHHFTADLRRTFNDTERFKGMYCSINASYTMRQFRAPDLYPFDAVREMGSAAVLPASFDFADPPDAYFLLGASAGMRFGNSSLSLDVENALNTAYRDYMNRFRYFADEMGINVLLRFQHLF